MNTPPSAPGKLLVVDDEEANRDMLSRRLKRAGYTVELAADGASAQDLLQRQEFDLVLLDQMMPGMTGLDLLRLLRGTAETAELPVIMVTALSDSQQVVTSLAAGANDYVTKPVDFPVALARIERHLQQSRMAKALRTTSARYELAAENSGNCIFDWDLRTDICHFDGPWESALGLRGLKAARGEAWLSQLSPADQHALRDTLRSLREGSADRLFTEHRFLRANGTVAWLRAKGTVVRDNSGYPWRLVGSCSEVTEERTRDAETGLPNALWLEDYLQAFLGRWSSAPSNPLPPGPAAAGLTLFAFDFSSLRLWRDRLGSPLPLGLRHEIAARFAAQSAEAAHSAEALLASAPLVRLSTYELVLVVDSLRHADAARSLGEALLASLQTPLLLGGQSVPLEPRAALLWLSPEDKTSPGEAIHQLHAALDAARRQSAATAKAQLCVYSPELERASQIRLESSQELREGIERQEFELWYQPKISLRELRLEGFEALARWRHPVKGLLGPASFIPLAETSGLMAELGNLILRQACHQFQSWRKQWPAASHLRISVNVSPAQLLAPDFVALVAGALADAGLPAATLCLEITESAMIEQMEQTREKLEALRALGVGLELDDFGTGYASLQHLRSLPFTTLKIDQAFLRGPQADPRLLESIIGMARSLGLHCIAEGVESEEHLQRLRQLGCPTGQGYYFSRPLPAQEAGQFLAQGLA